MNLINSTVSPVVSIKQLKDEFLAAHYKGQSNLQKISSTNYPILFNVNSEYFEIIERISFLLGYTDFSFLALFILKITNSL